MDKRKLLIVDDDSNTLTALNNILKANGEYDISMVQRGNDAIEYVRHSFCDLVITDLKLPDIDGIEVLENIKKINPSIEVIMLTAYASVETSVRAINQGAYSYILKPYDIDNLKIIIRRAVEKQKLDELNRELVKDLQDSNEQLRKNFKQMKELSEDLEKRVDKATKQLKKTNDELATKVHELSMLQQINQAMQGTLKLENLLHLILTSVTAGRALGFNRAMLFLVNTETNMLEGEMAVGPVSRESAYNIWAKMSEEDRALEELFQLYDKFPGRRENQLSDRVEGMKLSLDDASDADVVVLSVMEKRPFIVSNVNHDSRVSSKFKNFIEANAFAVVPLIAKDTVIGVIVADNLYSGHTITHEHVRILTVLAGHAGLAIEKSRAYENLEDKVRELRQAYVKLERTKDELIRSEKLIAIGRVAASVAHEIRNPLVSIGGFARLIKSNLLENDPNTKSFDIIIEEVDRLEKTLVNVLDYTRTLKLVRELKNINDIIGESLVLLNENLISSNVAIITELDQNLPDVSVDSRLIKQALINIIQNAVHAMTQGGRLTIRTNIQDNHIVISIADTGEGIPKEILADLFMPFFTTKIHGSGLGLAVSQKIVQQHNGAISVTSQKDAGTTVIIKLCVEGGDNL